MSDQEKKLWALLTTFPTDITVLFRVIILVLNVFIPGTDLFGYILIGVGTISLAFQYKGLSKAQLVIGILQLLTFTMIIGWIWAIGWSILVLWKGFQKPGAAPVSSGAEKKSSFEAQP